jgi:SAM-dependent methyltransferase
VTDFDAARAFWDAESERHSHTSWLEHPEFSLYALRQIDPVNAEWPVDWFQIWLRGRRFRRGLSIGCGTGAFERDIASHNLCDEIFAFDASYASLRAACNQRRNGDSSRVHYFAADFNRVALPRRTFDIVFFHQSLHHVETLEGLLSEVMASLRRGGLLYLDEYIGPSRFDWTDERLRPHRTAFAALPDAMRAAPDLELPIQQDDPSEAVRSSEILPLLQVGFDIAAFRPYGGNILSVLYPKLNRDALTDDAVETLIAADRKLVQETGESYYGVVVARPKRGLAGWLAARRYRELAAESRRKSAGGSPTATAAGDALR